MRIRRLGTFRFGDYYTSWIAIVLLLLFSIASVVLELPFLFVIFPLMYVVIWLGAVLVPHCEQFTISSDVISVFWGKKKRTIHLPSELTLVISYIDVCPPLTVHTASGNQTHILKDKFAVSILKQMPVEDVLESLHRNYIHKYTTSSIRTVFDSYNYIYSFACNQSLLDALIANRKCLLILPESLAKLVSFDNSIVNVYIDQGH